MSLEALHQAWVSKELSYSEFAQAVQAEVDETMTLLERCYLHTLSASDQEKVLALFARSLHDYPVSSLEPYSERFKQMTRNYESNHDALVWPKYEQLLILAEDVKKTLPRQYRQQVKKIYAQFNAELARELSANQFTREELLRSLRSRDMQALSLKEREEKMRAQAQTRLRLPKFSASDALFPPVSEPQGYKSELGYLKRSSLNNENYLFQAALAFPEVADTLNDTYSEVLSFDANVNIASIKMKFGVLQMYVTTSLLDDDVIVRMNKAGEKAWEQTQVMVSVRKD